MIDGIRIGLALIGLAITGGMLVYSIRLLVATRGGILSQGWKSIAMGAIALSIGLALSIPTYYIGSNAIILYTSVGLMNLGGLLFAIGLRSELNAWSLRRVTGQRNNPIFAHSLQTKREEKA